MPRKVAATLLHAAASPGGAAGAGVADAGPGFAAAAVTDAAAGPLITAAVAASGKDLGCRCGSEERSEQKHQRVHRKSPVKENGKLKSKQKDCKARIRTRTPFFKDREPLNPPDAVENARRDWRVEQAPIGENAQRCQLEMLGKRAIRPKGKGLRDRGIENLGVLGRWCRAGRAAAGFLKR